MKWSDIQKKVKNLKGKTPKSDHCVRNAVQRQTAAGKKGVAKTNYKNCGRKKALTPEKAKQVVGFVKSSAIQMDWLAGGSLETRRNARRRRRAVRPFVRFPHRPKSRARA